MSDQSTMASGDEGKPSDSTIWRLPLSATEIFDLVFTRHGGGEPPHEVATKQTAVFTVGDWSSAGRGKLFEFLSRVHDQHEAKIAHYDDLRHKSLQFGVTAFGALFALALNMDKLAGAVAVAVVMTALTVILFLVDLYYHGLTHRAAFEKDYARVKITELLNANKNDVFYFRAYGALKLEGNAGNKEQRRFVPKGHWSHVSHYFMALIVGGALSIAFFAVGHELGWLKSSTSSSAPARSR